MRYVNIGHYNNEQTPMTDGFRREQEEGFKGQVENRHVRMSGTDDLSGNVRLSCPEAGRIVSVCYASQTCVDAKTE